MTSQKRGKWIVLFSFSQDLTKCLGQDLEASKCDVDLKSRNEIPRSSIPTQFYTHPHRYVFCKYLYSIFITSDLQFRPIALESLKKNQIRPVTKNRSLRQMDVIGNLGKLECCFKEVLFLDGPILSTYNVDEGRNGIFLSLGPGVVSNMTF